MSLLGDLFEDEDTTADQQVSGPAVKCQDKVPPPPRNSNGLCGIFNQGATCYLNSLVQSLLMTPEFRGITQISDRTPLQNSNSGVSR